MKHICIFWVCAAALSAQVPYERILQSAAEPGSWLTYSGDYSGHRYSPLKQIDRSNVSRLKLAWMYQTNDLNQFEATPLVADGVMYISEPAGRSGCSGARFRAMCAPAAGR
jgi:alcohol dehydrogenase (cytochrome c)